MDLNPFVHCYYLRAQMNVWHKCSYLFNDRMNKRTRLEGGQIFALKLNGILPLKLSGNSLLIFVCLFETGSFYVALAGLDILCTKGWS